MRAFGAAVVCLLALEAHATWRSATIAGTPRDVVTVDAGTVVASSGPTGPVALYGGTVGTGLNVLLSLAAVGGAGYASAIWRPPGCLMGLQTQNAAVVLDPTCGGGGYQLQPGGTGGRLRSTNDGVAWGYYFTNVNQLTVSRISPATGTAALDWFAPSTGVTALGVNEAGAPLAALRLANGLEVAVFMNDRGVTPQFLAYLDGGLPEHSFFTMFKARDLALFDNGIAAGALMVDVNGTLSIIDDAVQGTFAYVDAGTFPSTATLVTNGGSAFGRGFGMLTAGGQIYSSVPNPAAIGRQWQVRAADAGFSGPLLRATCRDPGYCAAITNSTDGGPNVYVYFNEFAPIAPLSPQSVALGGSTPITLSPTDQDDDPLWISWDSGVYWDGGDPHAVVLVAPQPAYCSGVLPTAPNVVGVVSDGLAAHDVVISAPVTVTGTITLPPLTGVSINPPALSFTAGDPGKPATGSVDAGCGTPALNWSISSDAGFTITPGATELIAPPSAWCHPDAGTFTLTLTATNGNDAGTATIPVTLQPWGIPFAPVFSPNPASQDAGTSATYAPTSAPAHACDGTPGLAMHLNWTTNAGGLTSVSFSADGGPLTVTSTDSCIDGTVTATATREVDNVATPQISPPATLTVNLAHAWTPIDGTTPFDAGFTYDGGFVFGDFSVGANCLMNRGLRASVEIDDQDGGWLADGGGPAPGPWGPFVVPGGCGGGNFIAVATLYGDDGGPGPVQVIPFATGRIAAHLPALKLASFPVTCGGGASATLSLDLGTLDCATQTYAWSQTGGPALTVAPSGGDTVTFSTAGGDLDNQAGKDLTWNVTASSGPGNTVTDVRTVHLEPATFVNVSHRTDLPVALEEEAIGVEVKVTNTTSCAVTGLELHEVLGGLKVIDGTVRVSRAAPPVSSANGELVISGLQLGANDFIIVQYAARVSLLSTAHPSGYVNYRDVNVTLGSTGLEHPAASGCGCGSSPGETLGFLFLALGFVRRRSSVR